MTHSPVPFGKAHGLGNDFVLVAAEHAPDVIGPWARRMCDRHIGIGADGILVYKVRGDGVDMRLINADGGEVELSGNGVRCLGAYVVRKGWLGARHTVRTGAGPRAVVVESAGGVRYRVETDLGPPRFRSDVVPMRLFPPLDRVVDHPLEAAGGVWKVTATSLGNPHCAVFVDRPADDALVAHIGRSLENHSAFPERTNVEFVTIVTTEELRVRFWERGVGLTRASGTGAASAAVAAVLTGRGSRRTRVVCDGGSLDVHWLEDGPVMQTGEVELLFEGQWLLPE
jgi:diaminopimelate epimerase